MKENQGFVSATIHCNGAETSYGVVSMWFPLHDRSIPRLDPANFPCVSVLSSFIEMEQIGNECLRVILPVFFAVVLVVFDTLVPFALCDCCWLVAFSAVRYAAPKACPDSTESSSTSSSSDKTKLADSQMRSVLLVLSFFWYSSTCACVLVATRLWRRLLPQIVLVTKTLHPHDS